MNADTGEFVPIMTSDQIRSSWLNKIMVVFDDQKTPLFPALQLKTSSKNKIVIYM